MCNSSDSRDTIRLIPIGNVRECRSLQQIKDRYPNDCYEQRSWLSFYQLSSFFPWPSATTTVYLYRDGNRLTYPEGSPAEIKTAAQHLGEGRRLVIIAFANIDQGKDQLKELGRSRVAEYHRDKADRIRIIVLQNTYGTLDEEDLIFIGPEVTAGSEPKSKTNEFVEGGEPPEPADISENPPANDTEECSIVSRDFIADVRTASARVSPTATTFRVGVACGVTLIRKVPTDVARGEWGASSPIFTSASPLPLPPAPSVYALAGYANHFSRQAGGSRRISNTPEQLPPLSRPGSLLSITTRSANPRAPPTRFHYAANHPGKPFVPTADPVDEDPAEIAAYIAERRRRFPSRENIRKKLEEEQQKHQKRQKLNSGFASTDSVGKINGINGEADALNHDDNGDRSSFLDKDDIEEDEEVLSV
ncbi:hypothetical protein HDU84_002757 [Entophlyctis sp. JEL0112]|nr:hypothetical protein HDU84_002757 [Entophlyctis sp. JEL0112]